MGYRKFVPKNYELSDIFKKQSDRDKVEKIANDLIGKFRCYSLHCGGIVIFSNRFQRNIIYKILTLMIIILDIKLN